MQARGGLASGVEYDMEKNQSSLSVEAWQAALEPESMGVHLIFKLSQQIHYGGIGIIMVFFVHSQFRIGNVIAHVNYVSILIYSRLKYNSCTFVLWISPSNFANFSLVCLFVESPYHIIWMKGCKECFAPEDIPS